jgi:hypothetical protein
MTGSVFLPCATVLSPEVTRNVQSLFNNNRDDFAPRSAAILRGLFDEAGVPASGGLEPPPMTPTLV